MRAYRCLRIRGGKGLQKIPDIGPDTEVANAACVDCYFHRV